MSAAKIPPLQQLIVTLDKITQTDREDERGRADVIAQLQQAQQLLQEANFELAQAREAARTLRESSALHLTRLTLSRVRQRLQRLCDILRAI